jgi:type IV pilus assembly protein PilY1
MRRSLMRIMTTRKAALNRRRLLFPIALASGASTLLITESANAQIGAANVPLPDVLILLDTSGSFEKMIDGLDPEDPSHNPSALTNLSAKCDTTRALTGIATDPNRWGIAVQALTGDIQPYYSCVAMDRTQPPFAGQFGIRNVGANYPPYDFGYYLNYHRPVGLDASSGAPGVVCANSPLALPGAGGGGVGIPPNPYVGVGTGPTDCDGFPCNADDFPPTAIGQYIVDTNPLSLTYGMTINNPSSTCNFVQSPNGAIDGAKTIMRFGLMTFDNDPQPGTGVNFGGATLTVANTTTSPFDGQWSYFHGWTTSPAGAIQGAPAGCTTVPLPFFEVGARNDAAPPWEGRHVRFPDPNADTTAVASNNGNVELAIASMRPYGATPLAGLFDDAEEYLWNDPNGPTTDSYVQGGCRQQFIVLISDGAPNLDLRPSCGPPALGPVAPCPYETPDQIAAEMCGGTSTQCAVGPPPPTLSGSRGRKGIPVTTYVIGFAVSEITPPPLPAPQFSQCSQLVSGGTLNAVCTTPPVPSQYQPCCALQQIAVAGGTGQAYFADTPGDLNAALGAVLGQIAKQLDSKTLPAYSPSVTYAGSTIPGGSSLFLSSFNGGVMPWRGDVQRQQILCQGGTLQATRQPVDPTKGDDFAPNLAVGAAASSRSFLGFTLPAPGGGTSFTIRPYDTAPADGLPPFGVAPAAEVGLAELNLTHATFTPTALNVAADSCLDPVTKGNLDPGNPLGAANACTDVALAFLAAMPSVTTPDPNFNALFANTTTRCGGSNGCNPLGAILHSNPAVSVPPNALLRDDSYQAFATSLTSGLTPPRYPMLYVATTDGLLHAFNVESTATCPTCPTTSGINNEEWAFIPPGVEQGLIGNYPSASEILLDGAPVVKDVVWNRQPGGTTAQWQAAWHTMLVAGFGAGGRGYYALDVSDPRGGANYKTPPVGGPPPPLTGPHFQWQITSMNNTLLTPPVQGQPELFGIQSATPTIATIFADLSGGTNPQEIGVAILPGGKEGTPYSATPCERVMNHTSNYPPSQYDLSSTIPGGFFGRRQFVRGWAKNCFGPKSNVPGRSVTIVNIQTGDIIAVFARNNVAVESPDFPPILNTKLLIPTPLDSPMVGTALAFPNDVGAVAQRFFIGDADGTMWRFDISDPNPANWKGALYLDAYNADADKFNTGYVNHLASDSQSIVLSPITTLDRFGNLSLQFATGDQETYTSQYTLPGKDNDADDIFEQINFVYSIQEQGTGSSLQTQVNWFYPLRFGERVTGPMAVFDNKLYYTTFAPPNAAPVCNAGQPKLWSVDYQNPLQSGCGTGPNVCQGLPCGCGGDARDFNPSQFLQPPALKDDSGVAANNIVIPGVSVAVLPSCADTTAPAADQYTGGMHTTTSGATPGTYSLIAQVGGTNAGTKATQTITQALKSPTAATTVDSWAALAE